MVQDTLHKEVLTTVRVHQRMRWRRKDLLQTIFACHLDSYEMASKNYEMDRAIDQLRDDLKHERNQRYALTNSFQDYRKEHET